MQRTLNHNHADLVGATVVETIQIAATMVCNVGLGVTQTPALGCMCAWESHRLLPWAACCLGSHTDS